MTESRYPLSIQDQLLYSDDTITQNPEMNDWQVPPVKLKTTQIYWKQSIL